MTNSNRVSQLSKDMLKMIKILYFSEVSCSNFWLLKPYRCRFKTTGFFLYNCHLVEVALCTSSGMLLNNNKHSQRGACIFFCHILSFSYFFSFRFFLFIQFVIFFLKSKIHIFQALFFSIFS